MDLTGKTALVTGAAHRVGKAIALVLARAGANVVVHYGRSEDAAQQTADEISALGVGVLTHSANLADPDAINGLFTAAEERFAGLDVLVNSAASFTKEPFDDITPRSWDRVLNVNLRAPFLCTQAAARLMGSQPEAGLVVNIGDLSGVYPWRGYTQHGVSKAGLIHLTKITARELAPRIRVNALVLGPILPPPDMSEDDPAWHRIEQSVPLGRSADPAEVGRAVLSLVENDFITGAIIDVTGGEHLAGAVNH